MEEKLNALISDPHVRMLLDHSIEKRALFISYPKEINVSNFLAWLFNPREGHGLGDKALKELLNQARDIYDDGVEMDYRSKTAKTICAWDATRIFGKSLSNVIIQRELRVSDESNKAIDLAIFDRDNKIAIFIELKFGAREGLNQTNVYCDNICENLLRTSPFKDYDAMFVFLDHRDEPSKDNKWIPLGTDWLVSFLKRQKDNPIIHDSNKKILSEFAEVLDDEQQMQMHRLLSSHRESIDSTVLKHKEILEYFHVNLSRTKYSKYISTHPKSTHNLAHTYYQSEALWDFLVEHAKFTPLIAPLENVFPGIETEPKKINIFYHLPRWDEMYVDDFELWGVQIWLKIVDKDKLKYSLHTHFRINSFKPEYEDGVRQIADGAELDLKRMKKGTNRITFQPVFFSGNEQKAASMVIERIRLIEQKLEKIR